MNTFETHDLGNGKRLIVFNYQMANIPRPIIEKEIKRIEKGLRKQLNRVYSCEDEYVLVTVGVR